MEKARLYLYHGKSVGAQGYGAPGVGFDLDSRVLRVLTVMVAPGQVRECLIRVGKHAKTAGGEETDSSSIDSIS